jgi:hypothetical protein
MSNVLLRFSRFDTSACRHVTGDLVSLRGKTVYYLASAAGFGATIPKTSASLTIAEPEPSLQINPRRIQTTPQYNDESVGRRRGSLRSSCEIQRLISCIFSRIDFIQSCAGKLKSFSRIQIHSLDLCCVYYLVVLMKCSLNNLLRNSIFI